MAINTGDLLMGLGAAIGGTGPQFIQGLDQRDQQKRAELQARQQAMYQDAATGLQLVRAGDLDGLIALGEDRLQLLQTYPDADPSDTQRIIQNARFAKQGDPVALRNLATELTSATSRGMSMGLIKMPEAQKPMIVGADETVFDPVTQEALYTGPGKPADRKTAEDQNGVLRFIDTGEPVYPDVQAPSISPEERTSALNNVRSNVQGINKNLSEIVGAYNKVIGLEPAMRGGSRAAINAAIMNVSRLISPGVVTDNDANALAGQATTIGELFSLMNGAGLSTDQLMRIYDPKNPETFDIDGLLSIAKSVTSAGVPSLLAQLEDEASIADIYGASTQFRKAYLGDTKLKNQISDIMKSVSNPQTNIPSFANDQEAEAAYNAGKIKLGQTIIVGGKQAVVEE
jgi:hypothetical protein